MRRGIPSPREIAEAAAQEAVIRLYCRALSIPKIAEKTGKTKNAVRIILRNAHRSWKQFAMQDLSDLKVRQIAKLEEVEGELWKEWERSKIPIKKTSQRVKQRPALAPIGQASLTGQVSQIVTHTEASSTEEAQCADPRYMEALIKTIKEENALLGIDDAKPIGNANAAGSGIDLNIINSEEQRAKVMRLMIATGAARVFLPAGAAVLPDGTTTPVEVLAPDKPRVFNG